MGLIINSNIATSGIVLQSCYARIVPELQEDGGVIKYIVKYFSTKEYYALNPLKSIRIDRLPIVIETTYDRSIQGTDILKISMTDAKNKIIDVLKCSPDSIIIELV